jgi:hypothetical protein
MPGDYAQPTWGRLGHEDEAESWGDEWGRGVGGSRRYIGGYGFERGGSVERPEPGRDEPWGGGRWSGRRDDDRRGSGIGRSGHEARGFAGRGPKGYQRSDERIREEACERLTDDDRVDASEIDVQVDGGIVILTGIVDDRRQKRAAEDAVEDIPGVHDVHNQLRVARAGADGRSVDHQPGPSGAEHSRSHVASGLGNAVAPGTGVAGEAQYEAVGTTPPVGGQAERSTPAATSGAGPATAPGRRGGACVGYDVVATDGEIGKVDEDSDQVGDGYLVVDTGWWIFGKKRLLPTSVIADVDHAGHRVIVQRTKDQIRDAPDYDPQAGPAESYRRASDYYRPVAR